MSFEPEPDVNTNMIDAVEATDAANDINNLQAEEKTAQLENNKEVLKEIKEKRVQVSKNVLEKLINNSFKGDVSKSAEVNKIVSDAFDKFTGDPEVDLGIWSDAEAKISALDKSFGTKCLDVLKYPFEKMYDAFTSVCDYFTSPEGKVKQLALEKYNEIMNDPTANRDQKIEAGKEYAKTIKEIKPELDKSDQKGESEYGEAKWTIIKLLFFAGGVIGALAIIARSLNGCYQYKIGKDRLKLLTCDDFYHKDENHSFCSCGSPATPLVCDDNTNNYPYCKCAELGVQGQVCNMEAGSTSQLYYSYDDSHSAWSVFGDIVVGAYGLLKDTSKDLGDFWAWFKKYGWIVLLVLAIVIGLPFIIGAINTTKEVYHLIHPDGTTETTTKHSGGGDSHFKTKRR
jgi:hypothetical protein